MHFEYGPTNAGLSHHFTVHSVLLNAKKNHQTTWYTNGDNATNMEKPKHQHVFVQLPLVCTKETKRENHENQCNACWHYLVFLSHSQVGHHKWGIMMPTIPTLFCQNIKVNWDDDIPDGKISQSCSRHQPARFSPNDLHSGNST